MRIFNRQLEEIENEELQEKVNVIISRVKDFLINNYGIDSSEIEDRIQKLSIVTFSRENDSTLIKEFNGEKRETPKTEAAWAFHGQRSQTIIENRCYFENAIFIDDTYEDSTFEHVFSHEFFHHMSADFDMTFDENDVALYKTGISIGRYDMEDNPLSIEGQGINEGITEMLASEYSGEKTGSYHIPVIIATILNNKNNPYMMKAYFSTEKGDVEAFFNDFDSRQSRTTSEQLKQLPANSFYYPIDADLLRGCLEYSLGYCENMEQLIEERKRILPVFKEMNLDLNYRYNEEGFNLRQMVEGAFDARREELITRKKDTQTLGEEVMDELKNTRNLDGTEQKLTGEERAIGDTTRENS